jgi:hypothetical protein
MSRPIIFLDIEVFGSDRLISDKSELKLGMTKVKITIILKGASFH